LFEVAFKSEPHARFLIDFDQDAAPLSAIGKPLLLEVLKRNAAHGSPTSTIGRQRSREIAFSLTGKLSPEGLAQSVQL
jgi:hypothetical protein